MGQAVDCVCPCRALLRKESGKKIAVSRDAKRASLKLVSA